eukprot:jgi/Ulvmu1/12794/UM097_0021.1
MLHTNPVGDPQAALRLVAFPSTGNAVLSSTPFGGKIETALRLAGLEYTVKTGFAGDKEEVPKGKFPVLRHGKNIVPDSSAIFDYLTCTYPKEMAIFQAPDDTRAALGTSLQRMLEEHTYFVAVYSLWQRKEVVYEYGARLITSVQPLPSFLLTFFTMLGHRSMIRALHGQEVRERLRKDLAACCALLEASGEYLTGATPCQADCFLFALVHLAREGYAGMPHEPMIATEILAQPALMRFYDRMWPRVFPEAAGGGEPVSRWAQRKASIAAAAASKPRGGRLTVAAAVAAAVVAVGAGTWCFVRVPQ